MWVAGGSRRPSGSGTYQLALPRSGIYQYRVVAVSFFGQEDIFSQGTTEVGCKSSSFLTLKTCCGVPPELRNLSKSSMAKCKGEASC